MSSPTSPTCKTNRRNTVIACSVSEELPCKLSTSHSTDESIMATDAANLYRHRNARRSSCVRFTLDIESSSVSPESQIHQQRDPRSVSCETLKPCRRPSIEAGQRRNSREAVFFAGDSELSTMLEPAKNDTPEPRPQNFVTRTWRTVFKS